MGDARQRSDTQQVHDALRAEHRVCFELISQVEHWLGRRRTDPGDWLAQVHEHMAALSAHLRTHFAHEETSFLYTELELEFPRFAGRLRKLRGEHSRMLDAIHQAMSDVRAAMEGADVEPVFSQAQQLAADLRRHEVDETEIIMSAYWQDLGGTGE